jgi:hypothetical protein
MYECIHRASERKHSLKNVASTPAFSLSIHDVCRQTNAIDHIGKLEFVSARIIQVRPSRNPRWRKQGAWEIFDADRVNPVYYGENARDSALSYARQRAGYGRAEIQVLDEAWNVVEMIGNEEAWPLV